MKGIKMKKNVNEIFLNGTVKSRKKIAVALFGLLLVPLSTGSVRGVDRVLDDLNNSFGALVDCAGAMNSSIRALAGSRTGSVSHYPRDVNYVALGSSLGTLAHYVEVLDYYAENLVHHVRALKDTEGSRISVLEVFLRELDRPIKDLNVSVRAVNNFVSNLNSSVDLNSSVIVIANSLGTLNKIFDSSSCSLGILASIVGGLDSNNPSTSVLVLESYLRTIDGLLRILDSSVSELDSSVGVLDSSVSALNARTLTGFVIDSESFERALDDSLKNLDRFVSSSRARVKTATPLSPPPPLFPVSPMAKRFKENKEFNDLLKKLS
jgi:hypothetical protein